MTEFTVNANRVDPYKNFKFRLKWDGRYVAGVSKISALKRTTEVVEYREGGQQSTSHKAPGKTVYWPLIVERGLTHDTAFEDWANLVWKLGGNPESALANFRKDIVLEIYNEAMQLVFAYRLHRCWVSEYQAVPNLDANATGVAIEMITIQHEGWERDLSVTEPKEPSSD